MSYQVLARKWRPRKFGELVGQEHVVRALTNALDSGRVHHAFLFTGTRGVGKTTIARIFAKSLNCETGVGSQPCGVCKACEEINAGRFVDLIEIDAASRTKVEDTREILDNVQYAPTRGRYKVYLIDEVHMLSNSSFNALLKTLEEPPPHVKFLLATTDPQKLPVTVLSRCLQFNLKRLSETLIEAHLTRILQQENIDAESPAIVAVAKAADGSMRDALSLLDQAIAYGGGVLHAAEVQSMLGTLDRRQILPLVQALAAQDVDALMAALRAIEEASPDFDDALAEVLQVLHDIALVQAVPDAAMVDEDVRTLAQGMLPEDVQLYYQIGLLGRRDLPYAPTPRTGFAMTLLRMHAFRPIGAHEAMPVAPSVTPQPAPIKATVQAPPMKPEGAPLPSKPEQPATPAITPQVAQPVMPSVTAASWPTLIPSLGLGGMALEFVRNCSLVAAEPGKVTLLLDPAHENLRTEAIIKRVEEALIKVWSQPTRVHVQVGQSNEVATPAQHKARDDAAKLDKAAQALEQDPTVVALKQTFNAQIFPGSIEAVEPTP